MSDMDAYLDAINEGTIDPLDVSPKQFADRIAAAIADSATPEPTEEADAKAEEFKGRHLTVSVTFEDHTQYTAINDVMHVNKYEELSNRSIRLTGLSYTTGKHMVLTVEYPEV